MTLTSSEVNFTKWVFRFITEAKNLVNLEVSGLCGIIAVLHWCVKTWIRYDIYWNMRQCVCVWEIKRKMKALNPGSIYWRVFMVIESQSTVAHLHVSEVKSQDTDTLTTHSESTRDVILTHAAHQVINSTTRHRHKFSIKEIILREMKPRVSSNLSERVCCDFLMLRFTSFSSAKDTGTRPYPLCPLPWLGHFRVAHRDA